MADKQELSGENRNMKYKKEYRMKKKVQKTVLLGILFVFAGCAPLVSFFGVHGKSIKSYPDIHESVTQDKQCLECHGSDNPEGPATPHPELTGCIKCHND